ncbi:UBA/TPR/DNAJ domain-containing protein Ucp7 [Schizosaccharomyces octosporus yFS286]|uniref:UBA/TPR/DNAJ domain-containing protein Ucp7 n=1 Tax=Schizosaccharomyces octosporus (strain yFS286) TaxID=483514 RepID=S9RAX8_SCHOY|nr:UBA/TPR/DNAJ domain-containing protein Ucp7 [Schizosaccharomyces octosporus yFS286]EPX71294.1 UBA/TPR/DNAJ domain-containing protein Ucp7 [Schizosaccharomyces octosporus yFS286]
MDDLLNFDLTSNVYNENKKKDSLEIINNSNSPVSVSNPKKPHSTKQSSDMRRTHDPFANLFQKKNESKNTSLNELERKTPQTPQTLESPSPNSSISHDPYSNLDVLHRLPKTETRLSDDDNKANDVSLSVLDSNLNAFESFQLQDEDSLIKQRPSSPEKQTTPEAPEIKDKEIGHYVPETSLTNNPSPLSGGDYYAQLRAMGFPDTLSRSALQQTGSLQEAIDYILEQEPRSPQNQTSNSVSNNEQYYSDKLSELQQVSNQIKDQFFTKATDLWNVGRQKLRTAVEERKALKNPNQPRWMTGEYVSDDFDNHNPRIPAPDRSSEAASTIELNLDIPLSNNEHVNVMPAETVPEKDHQNVDEFNDNLFSSLIEIPNETINHQKVEPSLDIQQTHGDSSSSHHWESDHTNKKSALDIQREEVDIDSMSLSIIEQGQTEGNDCFHKGDFNQAINIFRKTLSHIPEGHTRSIPLLCNRSLCYMKIGDIRSSLQDSQKALDIIGQGKGEGEFINEKSMNEYYVKSMIRKAQVFEQLEKYQSALEVWSDLLSNGRVTNLYLEGKRRCERALGRQPSQANSMNTTSKSTNRKSLELPKTSGRLTEYRDKQKQAEKIDEEKNQLREPVQQLINRWKSGKEGNIRALLSSMDTILWPECRWKPVSLADLVLTKRVKIAYMKAISCVHPDKLPQQATVEQRLIAESAFSNLNEAWDIFKQQNQL